MDLSNQNILVTGGSRGIGRGIVEQLLKWNASVVYQYRTSSDIAQLKINYPDSAVEAIHFDFALSDDVSTLFSSAVDKLNGLTGIVNNAGIAISSNLNNESWQADWEETIKVNLTGPALLCREAIQYFTQQKTGGRIVNISSRAAFRGDTTEYMAYASSKSGLIGLTRTIARGYGKQGVKAFLIAPGFVETDMAKEFINDYGEDFVKNDLALSSLTQPKEIAPTVAFLLSGYADHATGSTIDINAGSYVH